MKKKRYSLANRFVVLVMDGEHKGKLLSKQSDFNFATCSASLLTLSEIDFILGRLAAEARAQKYRNKGCYSAYRIIQASKLVSFLQGF